MLPSGLKKTKTLKAHFSSGKSEGLIALLGVSLSQHSHFASNTKEKYCIQFDLEC